MKFAFVVSGLEPGKDGVGDYTRVLVEELEKQGHKCALLALNDRHVSERVLENSGHPMLRMPSNAPWHGRMRLAEQLLRDFQPTWLSLQFVCYGWHPKGLPVVPAWYLRRLLRSYRVHVMMHEVGLGLATRAPVKEKAIGMAQKFGVIVPLLRKLAPQAVHTSNPAYAAVLAKYGLKAKVLPLFGNVPVGNGRADEWLFAKLREVEVPIDHDSRSQYWLGGTFGSIHVGTLTEPLVDELIRLARMQGKQLVLLSAGRQGGAGEATWQVLSNRYAGTTPFVALGMLPEKKISGFLNSLDFGIAATPWILLGKSGSVAAMTEHGLPIIVPRDDVRLPRWAQYELAPHPLWIRLNAPDFQERVLTAKRIGPNSMRSSIAAQLLRDLKVDYAATGAD